MRTLASTLTSFKVPENIPFYDPTEDEKRDYERRKFERIKQSGIPKRFWNADIAKCEASTQLWAGIVEDRRFSSLFIQGGVGNGKTYEACAAMISLMPEIRCEFATFDGILDELKESYGNANSVKQVINHYSVVPVLCIDDLGTTNPTEWNISKLKVIIDNRWGNERPTIITTQYSGQKLLDRLTVNNDPEPGKAILSRVFDEAVKVVLSCGDRRLS